MVVGAFNQVQQSLRWFVENTGAIADWRATLLRVMNFRQALLDLDEVEAGAGLIERRRGPAGPLHARRGPGRDPARLHRPRPAAPRSRARRARAHPRQAGLGAHQLLPGDRRALERRLGPHRRAPRRRGRLSDAAALPAVRRRCGRRLTSNGDGARRRRATRRAEARRPRRHRRQARQRRPLGPGPRPRGAGAAQLRAAAARPAEVADLRRGPRPAGRRQPADAPVDSGGRARGERRRQHLAAARAGRVLRQGGGARRLAVRGGAPEAPPAPPAQGGRDRGAVAEAGGGSALIEPLLRHLNIRRL